MIENLKNLMDHGFLIYKFENGYRIEKRPTPLDNRPSITNEETPNSSILNFNDYNSAYSKAMQLIESSNIASWKVMVAYDSGWTTFFEDLGVLKNLEYNIAETMAKKMAQEFIENSVDLPVETWEVNLKPISN